MKWNLETFHKVLESTSFSPEPRGRNSDVLRVWVTTNFAMVPKFEEPAKNRPEAGKMSGVGEFRPKLGLPKGY